MIDYSSEPLLSTPKKPEKLSSKAWFAVNTPTTYWVVGQKRGGKGVAIDTFIERWLKAGIFVLYIHSAGGFESLYLAVNKNCKARWKRAIENKEISEEGRLHCNCHRAVPIVAAIPDFIKINQESVDRYNGVYWSGFDEYNEAYISCKVDEIPVRHLDYTKIKKPKELRPYPLITFKTFTVPINTRSKDNVSIFREQFLEMVLDARKTHRPLILAPSFFPETHKGKLQKYQTLAEIFMYLPEVSLKNFGVLRLDKPREQWTKWEKSHHKIGIVANEMRKFAPSQKLSGDPESKESKRSWYNYLPESRHNKSFIVGDLQSSADMFVGIRNQDDIRIIKRSSMKLLGTELGWFALEIDKIRENKIIAMGFDPKYPRSIPKFLLDKLDQQYPRVTEIPDNKGYVLFNNGEFKLTQFNTPCWHHKSDRDDFYTDTGIHWEVLEKETETEKPKESKSAQDKVQKADDMKLVHAMRIENKSWEEIIKHFTEKEKLSGITDGKWSKENMKKLSGRYGYWLSKSGLK